MKIIDLSSEYETLYFQCLEDWSEEIREAGDHRARWYEKYRSRGLRVKLALDDSGTVGGMIQYLPIEHTFAAGRNLYMILCIWVHGHKQGRGNFQKQGMGKALLSAAEADAKERGAKGMAAWGILLPFWMKASWFKKQGYSKADRDSIRVLLWKKFTEDATPPSWIRRKKVPAPCPGTVTVTCFKNGWCPVQNLAFERAQKACAELGDAVIFREVDTSDRETFLEWGIADGLFINGKEMRIGPPPSYQKIKKQIMKQLKKL